MDTPNVPPPPYGAVNEEHPNEPPPKYETPKDGPYSRQPYPPMPGYPPAGPNAYPPAGPNAYPPAGPNAYPPAGQNAYPTQSYPAYQPPGMQTEGQPVQVQPGYGTVHQTVVVTDMVRFGPYPLTLECPQCHALITTDTSTSPGAITWLSAGIICLFGCWLGCCLIPFCIPDLQDVEHRCPNCRKTIGTYTRL